MLSGFAIGILGHLSSSRWLVAAGVILICLGAFLFPLALNADHRNAAAGREVAPSPVIGLTIGRPVFRLSRRTSRFEPTSNLSSLRRAGGLATVFAACGSSDSGSSDERPADGARRTRPSKGSKTPTSTSRSRSTSAATKAATSTSASPARSRAGGDNQLPELDMTAEASGSVGGKDVDFEGGLVLVPNKAYVSYEGDDYEVDPTTFSFIEVGDRRSAAEKRRRKRRPKRRRLPGRGRRQAQRRRLRRQPDQRRLAPTSAAPKRPRSAATSTSPSALDAITRADRRPGLQLAAGSGRPAAAGRTRRSPGRNRKGAEDRPTSTSTSAKTTSSAGSTAEFDDRARRAPAKRSKIELDLSLNGVNEEQEITTPTGAKPLNDLFQKLGVNPIELLQGAQSGGRPRRPARTSSAARPAANCRASAAARRRRSAAARSEYLECVQGASTPVDLQNCAKKLQ